MARASAQHCPHDCSRCRGIESGQKGPYSPGDLLRLGLVVFPEEEAEEPSAELSEAQLRVSLAEVAHEQARRDVVMVVAAGDTRFATPERARELNDGYNEAVRRFEEVGQRLVQARRVEREIAHRESSERTRLSVVESAAEFKRRRGERAGENPQGARVLERLRRGAGNGKHSA